MGSFRPPKRSALSWATVAAVAVLAAMTTTTTMTTCSSLNGLVVAEAFSNNNLLKGQQKRHGARGTRRVLPTAVVSASSDATADEESGNEDESVLARGRDVSELNRQQLFETLRRNLVGRGKRAWTNRRGTIAHVDDDGAFRPPAGSMSGRVVLITGASSGLGLESAKRLAAAGATVVLTARTADGADFAVDAARDHCRGRNPNPAVRGIELDLDDLSSVRSFPDRYRECFSTAFEINASNGKYNNDASVTPNNMEKIDVLVNNAGSVGFPSRKLTVDGLERTFQSCHLGHFLLTARLFEEGMLRNDDNEDNQVGRGCCTVINVASVAHRGARANHKTKGGGRDDDDAVFGFDFDNINSELAYACDEAYAQSKLANILFAKELERRANRRLRALSLHPGIVATDMWGRLDLFGYDPRSYNRRLRDGERLSGQPEGMGWFARVVASPLCYGLMTPLERGANCHVWLAYAAAAADGGAANVVTGGQHYGEFGTPGPVAEFAHDEDSARRLWEASEELARIRFDL